MDPELSKLFSGSLMSSHQQGVALINTIAQNLAQGLGVVNTAVIQALAANVKEPERAAALKTVPASVRSREEGLNWLTAKFPDDAKRAELLVAYSEGFQRASLDRVKELSDTAKDLRKSLEERLIKITPREPKWTPQHVVGMVITALFLSLGAPFWFNALRNLSNLRPVIAAKVEGRNAA